MPSAQENYKSVFDHRLGFGQKPAIVVIDFVRAYTTPESPLYAPDVLTAVQRTGPLLERARAYELPLIFTRVLYNKHFQDGGLFVQKIPALRQMLEENPLSHIVEELTPQPNDIVVAKQYASAFFGTSLASMLQALRVDTCILVGCSTSGCVRATAVDGMQHGFRVIVPRECVADRHAGPHEANLFDINAKYGDVMSLGEVMERLELYGQGRLET